MMDEDNRDDYALYSFQIGDDYTVVTVMDIVTKTAEMYSEIIKEDGMTYTTPSATVPWTSVMRILGITEQDLERD
jgi:hypothetical protein